MYLPLTVENPEPRPRTGRRIARVLLFAVLFVVVGSTVVYIFNEFKWVAEENLRFDSLAGTSISELIVSRGDHRVVITDSGVIDELIRSLKRPRVEAHHTNPVNEVRLVFPDGRVYLLARDSGNPSEFWLMLVTPEHYAPILLRQVQSKEAAEWLDRHASTGDEIKK